MGFLPAHALTRISKDFSNWNNSGITFNNVSDRPRNPSQKADIRQLKSIEFFRKNKNEKIYISSVEEDGKKSYHYARPIWIEKYCLKCRGAKKDAPQAIQVLYDTSYDYKIGELRGVLSVKIPSQMIAAKTKDTFLKGF